MTVFVEVRSLRLHEDKPGGQDFRVRNTLRRYRPFAEAYGNAHEHANFHFYVGQRRASCSAWKLRAHNPFYVEFKICVFVCGHDTVREFQHIIEKGALRVCVRATIRFGLSNHEN